MPENLKTLIQNWRGNTAGGNQLQLLSKLRIGDALYNIKDPAVEELAAQVETRLGAIESKTIRESALTKDASAGKFATSVTQGTDGQVSVTYSNVRDTALNDTAVDGQFITTVSQGVDGQVSIARAGVTAGQVGFTSTAGLTSTNVAGALDELRAKDLAIIGATTDGSTAITIYGSRAYAKELVDQLAGEDWTAHAKTVKEIIQEIEGSTTASAWTTTIDKLNGMSYVVEGVTTAATSVVDYVEHKIAEANNTATNGITAAVQSLDATVGSTTIATGKHVAVQVVETDGILTSLTVTEDDIAGASALAALDAAAVKSVNGITGNTVVLKGSDIALSEATATKLDAYVTNLSANKANKAAITSAVIQSFNDPSYESATETLTLSTTGVTAWVPVSGQSL